MQNVGAWRVLAGSTRCLHMMWSLGMCTDLWLCEMWAAAKGTELF